MVSRKRTRSEVDAAPEQPSEENGLLNRLRNCWEFANLMQYIAIFGKVIKIDEDFGIDVSVIFPMPLRSSVYCERQFCAVCPPSSYKS
jgi:DNA-directed RNA polymerase